MNLEDMEKEAELAKIHYSIQMVTYAMLSYDNFKQFVRRRLDKAARDMEAGANIIGFSCTEDQLTMHLVAHMKEELIGFYASHEDNQRGHCDITFKLHDFVWHCEAKKHSDYAYLLKGYAQLTERYSTGSVNSAGGGFIIYSNNKNSLALMTNWIEHLKDNAKEVNDDANLLISQCTKNPLVYLSNNKHTVSGLDYEVIHYPINLRYEPVDRVM